MFWFSSAAKYASRSLRPWRSAWEREHVDGECCARTRAHTATHARRTHRDLKQSNFQVGEDPGGDPSKADVQGQRLDVVHEVRVATSGVETVQQCPEDQAEQRHGQAVHNGGDSSKNVAANGVARREFPAARTDNPSTDDPSKRELTYST